MLRNGEHDCETATKEGKASAQLLQTEIWFRVQGLSFELERPE